MNQSQVEKVVKALRFKRRSQCKEDKDCYVLKCEDYTVFLYLFKDTPKGWRISVYINGEEWIRKIDKPEQIITGIAEIVARNAIDKERDRIKRKVWNAYLGL